MSTAIELTPAFFNGHASIEHREDGLRPWRLPHYQAHLYRSPNNGLMNAAGNTSGVRLRFATDATVLRLEFQPLPAVHAQIPAHVFDAVIDNDIVHVAPCQAEATSARFEGLPDGEKIVELWLPPSCMVVLTGLVLETGSYACPRPDRRPLWVTWGSSLSHCVRGGSAALTWPAIVARHFDLNLQNLGFGGQCCLDPTVAMYIRDQPADFISLKMGINTINGRLDGRTYPALVAGVVSIIREKHPHTPIALISPIAYPPHETQPNKVDYTISGMRADMAAVHADMVRAGDRALYYYDGLSMFNVEEIGQYASDQCHPNAEGIELQAANTIARIMPSFLGRS